MAREWRGVDSCWVDDPRESPVWLEVRCPNCNGTVFVSSSGRAYACDCGREWRIAALHADIEYREAGDGE